MHGVLSDIEALRAAGHDVVLTSSGAVALGLNAIGKTPQRASTLDKQAAAACGQPLLLNAYKQVAMEYGIGIAQILVTLEDMEGRRRFLNTKNTILRLFDRDIMPIVNENDTVATQELKVGDNDRLAAKIAQMIKADHFIILTSVDGLYDRDPSEAGAQLVEVAEDLGSYLEVTESVSALGSGGMLTKMKAAHMAQNAGCTTIIGRGTIDRPILGLLEKERPHTVCPTNNTPRSAFELWLTDRLQVAGSLIVDDAGVLAMTKYEKGIEAEHVTSLQGDFRKGDVVHLFNKAGDEVARGLTNFSADEVMLLAHDHERKVFDLVSDDREQEVVGFDNLVVLDDHHLVWDAPSDDMRTVSTTSV
jgi:glutamate 5-kinase